MRVALTGICAYLAINASGANLRRHRHEPGPFDVEIADYH